MYAIDPRLEYSYFTVLTFTSVAYVMQYFTCFFLISVPLAYPAMALMPALVAGSVFSGTDCSP